MGLLIFMMSDWYIISINARVWGRNEGFWRILAWNWMNYSEVDMAGSTVPHKECSKGAWNRHRSIKRDCKKRWLQRRFGDLWCQEIYQIGEYPSIYPCEIVPFTNPEIFYLLLFMILQDDMYIKNTVKHLRFGRFVRNNTWKLAVFWT